jgi:acetyltransferase-like isoleucine patch superfamily enzyme
MKETNYTNIIHPTAIIGDNVKLGSYNVIGKNVIIEGSKENGGVVTIGDCNTINDNTRILTSNESILVGDWNVFHNNMLVMADTKMKIGHNCWFGQSTILDSSGGLELGNGVRVGMYSQIWTHVGSGELIEGCTLFGKRKTIIEDNVWLVGSCIVSSGVTLGERGTFLIGSNITKDTESYRVYAGSPATLKDRLSFYKEIDVEEKLKLMTLWVEEYRKEKDHLDFLETSDSIELISDNSPQKLIFIKDGAMPSNENVSVFNLTTKKYTKTLNDLERDFYKFIYGHKARFTPITNH